MRRISKISFLVFLTLTLLALLDALFLSFFPIQDNDIWWILAAGREIVQTQKPLKTDVFSCAITGKAWLNKYQPFEILSYLVFARTGFNGLIALRSLLVLLSLSLLFFTGVFWRRDVRGFRTPRSVPSLLIASTAFLMAPRMFVRPELASFVFFSASCLLWEKYYRQKLTVTFYILILLIQVAWVNSHSAFILGWILCAAYLGERTFLYKQRAGREWTLLFGLALSSLVNPFGARMLWGVWDVLHTPFHHKLLMEWQPIFGSSFPSPLRWFIMGAAAIGLAGFILNRANLRWSHLALFLLFFGMTLKSQRHVGFFALYWGLANLWNFSYISPRVRRKMVKRRILLRSYYILVYAILLSFNIAITTNFLFPTLKVDRPFGFGFHKARFPIDSADFMQKERIQGNLFNGYDSGGYLIWRLHPDVFPCIDGRAEPFPPSLVERHWRIIMGEESPEPFCEEYGVAIALIDYDDRELLVHFRRNPGWALCHLGYRAVVFLQRTEMNEPVIERWEIPQEESEITEEMQPRLLLSSPDQISRIMPYANYRNLMAIRIHLLETLGLEQTARTQKNNFYKN
ncbi:hypothetical protein JW926_00705 [Candidatus Sumerlaeota bacterium]|nr:hypothetical protein [Candidatus Sumerlaeota bacterium]